MPSKKPTNDLQRWRESAAAVQQIENPLKVPYEVALREAGTVAQFLEDHWEKTNDRPGLSRVAKKCPKSLAEEIRSLVAAVQMAQTELLLIIDPLVASKGDRARFLVDELESHIEFLLDDDVDEPADAQLASLQSFHSQDGERSSTLAQALRDYGTLAKSLQDRLAKNDEEFDPRWIGEALALADELAKNPPGTTAAVSAAAGEATKLRNRLLVLLTSRVTQIRRASAHVFRGFPEIVRLVTSGYERRRRAAARKAKLAKEAPPDVAPKVP